MATYKIVSNGGNGLPLNVETTSTISGRTNVNIWKDTGSNDQKWSINSLGTSQQVRTLNNTAYMLNAYRTNWNCDVYTSNSDTYVNFVSQGNNVYLIQLNSDKTKYLTATGTASGSNVVWQARNTSSAAQKWKISKLSDLNISNLKIFQTYTSPGKSADGSVAPDMTYNDKTKSQLLSLSPVLSDEASIFDMPPSSSTVLPPQGPQAVKDHMMKLVSMFATTDPAMTTVAKAMFNHFLDGTGSVYRNSTLTQRAKNHSKTQEMVTKTKNIIIKYIKQYDGDIRSFYQNTAFQKELHDVPNPYFSTKDDRSNGLQICVNQVWGYSITLKNFRCTGSTFSGTLSYSLFDHFGLDDNDVEKIYGWTQQFCAWYVLQHYKNCKCAYKPFISYMDFDVSFSGSL